MFELIRVLKANGHPVYVVRENSVGHMVYEDDAQVIAEPFADTRTGPQHRRPGAAVGDVRSIRSALQIFRKGDCGGGIRPRRCENAQRQASLGGDLVGRQTDRSVGEPMFATSNSRTWQELPSLTCRDDTHDFVLVAAQVTSLNRSPYVHRLIEQRDVNSRQRHA